MSTIINGTSSAITFPDATVQNSAGLAAGGTIASGTIATATITTLNAPSGVLATQNGMTGIAKAWVNFNGSGGTAVIRGSFNISSITYNSAGDYTANFTNSMPNVNYSVVGQAHSPSASNHIFQVPSISSANQAVGSFRIATPQPSTGTLADAAFVQCAVFSS